MRPHDGDDPGDNNHISIHAPMKGATSDPQKVRSARFYFNPRTHEGCDDTQRQPPRKSPYFNPRTHEGCDAQIVRPAARCRHFNPRTHEGCDAYGYVYVIVDILISIHAPMKGATPQFISTHPSSIISIHAPMKGATQGKNQGHLHIFKFQSTHP